MFQKDNIGQSIWDTCAAIGNMLGEQLENLMGTTREPDKSKKSNSPHPSQKGKEKKQNNAPGVHAFSPHWLRSICMCFSPFLAFMANW